MDAPSAVVRYDRGGEGNSWNTLKESVSRDSDSCYPNFFDGATDISRTDDCYNAEIFLP